MAPNPPTLADFTAFIRNVMAINTTVLPDNSPTIPLALSVALAIVNPLLQCVGPGPMVAGVPQTSIYTLAVYNLAGDNLINYAPDQPNQTFFEDLRESFDTNGFVSGVISAAADESTSESMVVQEAAKNFTLQDLQNLKTPWGRQYLAFAQAYGPSVIGVT